MTTTRTIAPATSTTCTFAYGCDSGLPAVHRFQGADLCPFHSPYDVEAPTTLCTVCAITPMPFEGIEVDPICASCAAPKAFPAALDYPTWFTDLLAQDKVCTRRDIFEHEAYRGHISYELSMTDGHYAPQDFDAWVIGFRRDSINSLYHANDARYALAPRVNSYAKIMTEIMGG